MTAIDELSRPATDADVVGGVPARRVAAPASTDQAAALIAESAGQAVVVRGGGTKIEWGTPPDRLDLIIDTHRLTGVVEHAAGDLIAVVRAGTPLHELTLGDQQLALDAPLPGATVGGTVAANLAGPRRMLYGTARDLLIGITVVRPDAVVARSGGKVVKNVAGYDLGKLFTGSYGTLGLITECVFRLHPRAPAAATVTCRAGDPDRAGRLLAAVRSAQVAPSALEVDAEPGQEITIAALVEGTPDGVRARAATLSGLLGGEPGKPGVAGGTGGTPPWWGVLPWPDGGVGLKIGVPLSAVPDVLRAAADAGVRIRGSAGTGVLFGGLPGEPARAAADAVAALRTAATLASGHLVVLTAPPPVRDLADMWGPVPGLALMRRVKDRFDPDRRFAPGRFVGGI
ncbi:FAD-binding oxidoreductase [Mangrovihabitans endophyticus]|uniref:FAD-linked oxidase n=1 Tax=Mangrovihabitans endophyticus TaxID=1751298 RepID=A0A8J3C4E5_9ACTN|nr:FAD-binding oxidoreductase [Mangrovihabitans endophyticus]GGL08007.1 FAD-linked oxidase [Mangrovihabitans endophyticus]